MNTVVYLIKEYYAIIFVVFVIIGILITGFLIFNVPNDSLDLLNKYRDVMVAKIKALENNWYNFNKDEEVKIFKDIIYIKSKKNKDNFVRNLNNFLKELEVIKETKEKFDREMDNVMYFGDTMINVEIYEKKKSLDETFLFHIRKFEKESYGFSLKLLNYFVDEN
ncbi:hypothetical protein A0H76_2631 [Hepatospora eriocheir]|uniref:Uncharacterized protein n=1 Tax=Hepatospora eriocheir TaxID=1081669 RepID=A0A1X0QF14_9MICR|nr:hypothetical protein A0H76_2631 [Hepatospora eriocheir]